MGMPEPLSVRDHMALDLAGRQYKFPARRVADARETLGLSEAHFWQLVNDLIDRPAAEVEYTSLVRRLRRLRDARRAQRSGSRSA